MLISFQALTTQRWQLSRRMMRLFLTIPMHHQTFSHSSITMVSPATNYNVKKAVSVHLIAQHVHQKRLGQKCVGSSLNISNDRYIQVRVINNWMGVLGEPQCIPQIHFSSFPSPPHSSWTVHRHPVSSASCIYQLHSMVVQALTLDKVVLDLHTKVFTHVNSTQPYLEFATVIMHQILFEDSQNWFYDNKHSLPGSSAVNNIR